MKLFTQKVLIFHAFAEFFLNFLFEFCQELRVILFFQAIKANSVWCFEYRAQGGDGQAYHCRF
jgi:hypothetical protein